MENSEWLPIDLLDLVPVKDRPRVLKVQLWEMTSDGRFRYIDTIRGEYKYPNPVWIAGEKYFSAIIGWSCGNIVVKKWPVKDLVRRYFGVNLV